MERGIDARGWHGDEPGSRRVASRALPLQGLAAAGFRPLRAASGRLSGVGACDSGRSVASSAWRRRAFSGRRHSAALRHPDFRSVECTDPGSRRGNRVDVQGRGPVGARPVVALSRSGHSLGQVRIERMGRLRRADRLGTPDSRQRHAPRASCPVSLVSRGHSWGGRSPARGGIHPPRRARRRSRTQPRRRVGLHEWNGG